MSDNGSKGGQEGGGVEELKPELQQLLQVLVGMVERGELTIPKINEGATGSGLGVGAGVGDLPVDLAEELGFEEVAPGGRGGEGIARSLHGIRAPGGGARKVDDRTAPPMIVGGPVDDGFDRGSDVSDFRSMDSQIVAIAGQIKVDSMKLPKFDGSDYNNWRVNMELFFEASDVWTIVSGEVLCPTVGDDGTIFVGKNNEFRGTVGDLKAWRKLNLYACTILYGAMSTEMQRNVSHCGRDSSKIWTRLQNVYQQKAPLNRMYLQSEWMTFKMKPGWSVKKYSVEYQGLVEKMKAYDFVFPEESYVNQFLLGLTKEYELDRKMMSKQVGLTLDEATNVLISESLAKDLQSGKIFRGGTEAVANAAVATRGRGGGGRRGGGRGGGGRGGGRGGGVVGPATVATAPARVAGTTTCFTCGETGHWSKDCQYRTETVKKVCRTCKSADHLAVDCPQRDSGPTASANSAAAMPPSGTN